MNNKITISSLATLLSLKSGEPKKTCESFLREFFAIVTDQIAAGDNVKVKGFGTFKVISVNNRKSVDVNTGEEIEIPGHKKIVFVPAKELAEEVNAPFSAFESVEVNPDAEAELDSLEIEQEIEAETPGSTMPEAPAPAVPDIMFSPEPEAAVSTETESPIPATTEPPVSTETESPVPATTEPPVPAATEAAVVSDLSETIDAPEKPEPTETQPTETKPSETKPSETKQSPAESTAKSEAEYENSAEPIYFIKDDEIPESEKSEPVVEAAEIREETETSEMNKRNYGRGHFLWGFLLGVSATAVFGFLLYFFVLQKMLTGPEHDIDLIVKADSVATVSKDTVPAVSADIKTDSAKVKEEENFPDTNPSDRIVYDTVTTKCYLTTLAKKYYGNYNLWPYIYEENKAILGHPDRITPGTKVVIPPLSKYGVDPKNKDDVNKAKQMGDAIYSRYR